MDLGPIAGIRSVSLLNAQRAKREGTPNFEIDASARSGDEPNSNQQAPDRKPEREPEEDAQFVPQAVAASEDPPPENPGENASDTPEDKPEEGYDWFV